MSSIIPVSYTHLDIDVATCGEITPLSTLDYLIGSFDSDIITMDYRVRGFTRNVNGEMCIRDRYKTVSECKASPGNFEYIYLCYCCSNQRIYIGDDSCINSQLRSKSSKDHSGRYDDALGDSNCNFCIDLDVAVPAAVWILSLIHICPVMAISEEEAERYDATLEPMEKKYLPSQDEFYIMSHSFVEE